MRRTILRDLRAVLFDLDGTVYEHQQLIPGAAETIAHLRTQGLIIAFLTNTTSRGPQTLAKELVTLGIPASEKDVFNPTAIAASFLRAQSATAYLLVQPPALADFDGVKVSGESPDYVVVGDLGNHWTYQRLNHAFRLIHQGARLIALGMTRYYRAADGLWLDVGPIIAALQYATGVEPLVLGKPDPAFFRQVLSELGVESAQALMVGDDVQTDIAGGQAACLKTALVKTGKFEVKDLHLGIQPDLVLDSITALRDFEIA